MKKKCGKVRHYMFQWLACLVLMSVPSLGRAFVVDDLRYEVSDATKKTVNVFAANTDISGDLVIPETVEMDGVEYTVTLVGGGAFKSCSGLTSVVIPNTVKEISGSAFKWCSGLTSVTLPEGLQKISNQAFNQCFNLASVTIPSTVTAIEYDAFKACSKLSPLSVPDGVTTIEYDAFSEIDVVNYSGTATGSPWGAGRVVGKDKPAVGSSFVIGDFKFKVEDDKALTVAISAANTDIAGDVVLPSKVEYNGEEYTVIIVDGGGFRSCSEITSVVIPNTVNEIRGSAFKWCSNLTSVTIPESVNKIPNQAFNQCYNLESLTIPSAVTLIEYDAFKACAKLSPLNVPDGVTNIEYDAFSGIDTVYYSGNATGNPWSAGIVISKIKPTKGSFFIVGDYKYKVEDDENLTVAISAASTEISGDLVLPSKVVYNGEEYTVIIVDGGGFRSCAEITSVVIPNTVQEIRGSAFKWCSKLTSVTIPEGINKIPNQAFNQCYSLENLTIPSAVTLIEYDAFKACEKLSPLTVPDGVASIEYDAFSGIDTVYYSGDATGNPWSAGIVISKIKPTKGSFFIVGDYKYKVEDDENLTVAISAASTEISGDLVLPSKVVYNGLEYTVIIVDGGGFRSCAEITSVVIPNTVNEIRGSAFKWCSKLTSVTIPEHITKIPNQAFNQCYNLENLTIPSGVTLIEYDAFKACGKLSPLTVPDDASSIEYDAFSGIDTVYYSGNATGNPWGAGIVISKIKPTKGSFFIVGDYKYKVEDDKELTVAISAASTEISGDLVLPSKVEYNGEEYTVIIVDGGGFRSCAEITSVVIPNTVQEIRGSAFKWCSKLTSVTIPEGINKIPNQAFNQCYSLENLTIPSAVTLIEYDAFKACEKLSPLTVPDGVASIEYDAFSGIDTVYYSGDATGNPWSAGIVISKIKPTKGSFFIVGDYKYKVEDDENLTVAISAASTEISGDLELPSKVVYNGLEYTVIIVDGGGFRSCGEITSVVIPNTVQEIRGSAFKWCSKLTSVTIPEHITKIPNQAFNQCYSLVDLTIPSAVTLIEYDAFKACEKLSPLTVPDSVASIEYDAFYGIDTVYYSGSATGNPWSAGIVISKVKPTVGSTFIVGDFKYTVTDTTNLIVAISAANTDIAGDIVIPSSVEYDGVEYTVGLIGGEDVFRSCGEITSVVIPNSVKTISGSAFKWCSKLVSVTLPDSIDKIPNQAFNQCFNLVDITIPAAVTSIEYDAFKACEKLSPLTISDAVTTIGYDAFSGIDTVYYSGDAIGSPWGAGHVIGKDQPVVESTFVVGDLKYTVTDTTMLTVAVSAANTDIAGDIVIPDTVEYNGKQYTVTVVMGGGFRSCGEITSVVIPNSVKTISGSAFKWCSKLVSVTLPDSIDKIPNQAFNQCFELENITIPASVTVIEYDAFKACEKLSPLTISDDVTSIEYDAFSGIDTVYYSGNATGNPWGAGIVISKVKPTKGSFFIVGDYKYKVEDDENLTVAISAASTEISGDLELPSKVVYNGDEYTVIIVDGGGFRSCTEITSVVIPNTVQEIRGSAFKWCSSLVSVTIPEHITKIPNQAFNQCYNLENLTIPSGVTLIEYDAFKACEKLSPLTVPDGASSIEYDAFYGIDTVYYSGSATGSPWSAGRVIGTTKPALNGTFVVGDFKYTVTDTTNLIVAVAAANTDIAGDIVIPSSVEYNGLEYTVGLIGGEGVFRSCGEITSVVIPNSVKTISGSAFKWCSKLVSVTLPDSIDKIPNQAFNQCYNLVDITIPAAVTSIDYDAFKACEKLSPLTISDDVTSIEYDAFSGIDTVYYSGNATGNPWGAGIVISKVKPTKGSFFIVGDYKYKVEDDENLTVAISAASTEISGDLELPSKVVYNGLEYTVTIVDGGGFRSCAEITSVVIPNTVQEIRGSAFKWCSKLVSVTIPEGIDKIPNQAFNQCYNLENLTIPSAVTLIEYDAFKACEKLSPLTVPDGAASIEYDAFYGIDTVYYSGNATGNPWSAGVVISKLKPTVGSTFIVGDFKYTITDTTNLIVAVAAANTDIAGDIVIPSSVEYNGVEYTVGLIGGEGVFRSCGEITSVVIPNSVKMISGSAFKWCSKLVSVTLPDSIDKIPNQAFNQCFNLVDITIPASVTSIDYDAFKACGKLSPLTISDDVTSIEYDAFSGIDTVYYSGNATGNPWGAGIVISKIKPTKGSFFIVGDYKYKVEDDENLTVAISAANTDIAGDLELPSKVVYNGLEYTVTIVDGGGFRSCAEITSVVIPNTVQEIRGSAFKWCSSLVSVTIPEHITKIPNQAFNQCYNLENLTIPSGVTLIEYDAFKACGKLSPLTVPDVAANIEYSAFSGIDTVYYAGSAKGTPWGAGVVIGKDKPSVGSVFVVGDFKYTVTDTTNRIVAVAAANTDISGDIVIPSSVEFNGIEYTVGLIGGEGVFRSCSEITSVVIPNSVKMISGSAFKWCSKLTSVTLPDSIDKIPNQAFNQCYNLVDITIPATVTSIEYDAFKACEKLSPLTVPDGVTSIEYDAFYDIDTVYYSGSAAGNPWGAGRVIGANSTDEEFIFSGVNNDVLVRYVGSDSVVVIPTHVKVIGDRAFYNCTNVTTVYIPNTVTSIENEAFSGCNSLTAVEIPNSVTSIGEKAFANCTGLTFMSIPNSVEYVGANVFKGCAGLMVEFKPTMLRNATTAGNAIYCEAAAQPAGWNKNWNSDACNTVWGAPFVTAEMDEIDEIMGNVIYAGSYLEGREATFIAQAAEGYHFKEWKEDGYADSVRTVVMTESMVFTPLFAPNIDGVSTLSSEDNVLIYTTDGTIFVENASSEVYVFSMNGQVIANRAADQSLVEISVPAAGAYVVRTGGVARIAIVR